MIAIKMDMPKSCMKCKFTNSLHEIHYCLFSREPITDYGWQKKRPDFCPLTELPEENKDMSWEELFKKLEQLKNVETVYKRIDEIVVRVNFTQREYLITKNGKIFKLFDSQKHGIIMKLDLFEDISYPKIYQIIKALIGETK